MRARPRTPPRAPSRHPRFPSSAPGSRSPRPNRRVRTQPVLWDVDLELPEGKLIAVVGPNGAGKSTLLKAILGLVKPITGWVKIFGESYEKRRSWVGYVPQRESVDWDFPTNALDVVTMGVYGQLGWFRRPSKAHREKALDCLDQVGIADLAGRQISRLSGGQQQRVFLARALAQEARLYFMDEPFAGVDATTERAIPHSASRSQRERPNGGCRSSRPPNGRRVLR